jgi:multidrug efflux pump subunit AcrB
MGVSFIPGVNVIDVGHALEAKLEQMSAEKPAGITSTCSTIRRLKSATRLTALSLTS